ncbi:hypothetical protein [Bradyrhizobium sp. NAS96.2]|uniref:hypothetical protein n=1 Tax=Bradyrhizobium sp. NAS96.2 TaxID=1680160 RepID=UPI00093EC059|nr:hypothetical protein [Bradyrhizobium sp. NAS96.2]OKO70922.1 hypothetical protein AC628_29525 [Bradyrhizobium sp. NAS96.2]
MLRILSLLVVILALLQPDLSSAASSKMRHGSTRWHGYGFLPGYRQPPNQTIPVLGPRGAARGYPDFSPQYWYGGDWHYFGRPGFHGGGRYNGGSYGPCWVWTPIGRAWQCG